VDLLRLITATGLAPEALVDWLAPDEVDMTGEPESFVLLDRGRRLMTLALRAGACRFLDAESRCAVHAARPTSCRAYPWDGADRLPFAICGHDSAPPPDAASSQLALQSEIARYAARVTRYNARQRLRRMLQRRPDPAAVFFAFLGAPSAAPGSLPR
jgi:Fe-S-cluster containining protein